MLPDPFDGAGSLRGAYGATDWAGGPLGPVASWGRALRRAVDLVLHTRVPATLLWGPELVLIYNEAYVPLIADKHPAALGAPAREVFPEVWETIGPLLHGVRGGGGAVWLEDALLPLRRRGRLEECWFTFSYSPVRGDDGEVEGVLDLAAETTQRIVDRRRLELLGQLSGALADADDAPAVVSRALPLLRALDVELPAVELRLPGVPPSGDPRLPPAPGSPLGGDLLTEDTSAGLVAWLPLVGAGGGRLGAEVEEASGPPVLVVLLSEHLAPDERYLGFLRLVAASLVQALERVAARAAERRAVAAQRASQERIGQLVESMAVGFLTMDADWRITYLNTEAERLAGATRAQLLGATLWEAFPGAVGTEFEVRYRQVAATGLSTTFDAHYPEPLDLWVEVRAVREGDGPALYFHDITARRLAQELAERAATRSALLAEVAAELAGALDGEAAVARLPRIVVPALADWCTVSLAEPNEHGAGRQPLHPVGTWHADPALRDAAERFAAPWTRALATAGAAVAADRPVLAGADLASAAGALEPGGAQDLLARLAPAGAVVLPLRGRGRTLGVLTAFTGTDRGVPSADDVATLREVTAQAGLALDNARLQEARRGLAEELQRSLLTELPELEHLQVAARYAPAAQGAQIGGDWYDAFVLSDGSTSLVVGDVSGHDRGAAVAMAQVRNVLRGVAHALVEPPAAVLSVLDRVVRDLAVGALATAVLAQVEQDEADAARGRHTLRWSNAGHPPPVLVQPDGRADLLTRPSDLLLGLAPDTQRHDHVVALEPGATLLLYTDGLVERRGEHLDASLERLRTTAAGLAGLDLEALCDALLAELAVSAEDDVALLALRARPAGSPHEPGAHG